VGRSPPVAAGMPLAGAGDVLAVPAGPGFGDYLRARGVEVEDFRATGLGHLLAVSGDTGAT
jgi:predicted membrane metal-binding protein